MRRKTDLALQSPIDVSLRRSPPHPTPRPAGTGPTARRCGTQYRHQHCPRRKQLDAPPQVERLDAEARGSGQFAGSPVPRGVLVSEFFSLEDLQDQPVAVAILFSNTARAIHIHNGVNGRVGSPLVVDAVQSRGGYSIFFYSGLEILSGRQPDDCITTRAGARTGRAFVCYLQMTAPITAN
jgi:hypothetical protein